MSRKVQAWADSFGPYGYRVRIAERTPGGMLYARIPILPYRGGARYREVSLHHADRERAKLWALSESDKLRAGVPGASDPTPTAARVFARYCAATKFLPEKRREKKSGSQKNDLRCAELWTRFLGPAFDLAKVTMGHWNDFIRLRGDGLIDTRGRPVPAKDAKRIRAWTLREDLEWLRGVCAWAVRNEVMGKNPVAGDQFALPVGEKRRRPIATVDRFEKIQGVAGSVHPALPVILTIVHHTARRIRAVLALRYSDLAFARSKQWPHGCINWPMTTDKMEESWVSPLSPEVRTALEAWLSQRPGIGNAYLFPDPRTATDSVRYETASKWLRKAERLAKVPKQDGSLWHAYRRGWATARKGHAVQDVCAAGGWKSAAVVSQIYQQADPASMYAVVASPTHELREAAQS